MKSYTTSLVISKQKLKLHTKLNGYNQKADKTSIGEDADKW